MSERNCKNWMKRHKKEQIICHHFILTDSNWTGSVCDPVTHRQIITEQESGVQIHEANFWRKQKSWKRSEPTNERWMKISNPNESKLVQTQHRDIHPSDAKKERKQPGALSELIGFHLARAPRDQNMNPSLVQILSYICDSCGNLQFQAKTLSNPSLHYILSFVYFSFIFHTFLVPNLMGVFVCFFDEMVILLWAIPCWVGASAPQRTSQV